VGQHIRNAASKMEEGSKLLNKVELRVEGLAGGDAADQPTLFEEKKKVLGTGF